MKCSQCGKTYENAEKQYCTACGHKLSEQNIDKSNSPKKFMNPKTLSIFGVILLIIISFSIFFIVGKTKFTPEKQVEAFQTAVKDKDYKQVEKLIQPYEKSFKINKDNTKVLVDFFADNPASLEQLVSAFNQQIEQIKNKPKNNVTTPNTYASLHLAQGGKKWLFFNDYHFEVVPSFIKLSTQSEDLQLYINDDEVATSTKDYSDVFGPFMPGAYTLKAKFENDYVTSEEENTIELFNIGEDNMPYTFDLEVKEIRVSSLYEGYDLFVNGELTDIQLEGAQGQNIGNFPMDGSVMIQIGKEYPWKQVMSEEKIIESDDIVFQDVEPLSHEEQIELMKQMNETFKQFIAAINKSDTSLLKDGASDQLKEELEAHIEKIEEMYDNFEGTLKEISYKVDTFANPEIDEEIDAYTLTIETASLIHEADGRFRSWTNLGEDKEKDATKYSRDFNIFYDEEKEQWLLDSTKMGYYFVFDRDAEIFEFK